MNDSGQQRVEDELGHGAYGPGALDEVTVPRADPVRESKDRDLHDPAHVDVDPDVLRNGGPTRTPGLVTTTGGTAGPASVTRPRPPDGVKVAPTTTGDAHSGGMGTPVRGTTSDNTTGGAGAGGFLDDE